MEALALPPPTRKPQKKRRIAVTYEVPPPQRGQHDALEVKHHDPKDMSAKRVQLVHPNRLRKYLALKSITEAMCSAGETLAADWDLAGLTPRQTTNLMASGGGYKNITDAQLDARSRLTKALAGDRKRYADLLVGVCCLDQSQRDTRRLRRGLILLAYHYGITKRGLT